jgi:uncharacterized protein (TIRG00374 family)
MDEPPPTRRAEGGRTWRRILRWGTELGVLAGAAVFVVFGAGGNLGAIANSFDHLRWHWLLVGAGAEVCSIFCLSWLQHALLRTGGLGVRVRDLLPVTMASNAVAQSLPAGTLFAEGYAFRQYQRLGASRALGAWAELAAGALATAALASVGVGGAAVVQGPLRWQLLPALCVVLVGALVAAGLFRRTSVLSRLLSGSLKRAERRLPPSWCRHIRAAETQTAQMGNFRPGAGLWAGCYVAALANWLCDAIVLVAGLLSVGGRVPWHDVVLAYAAAQLLVALPVTPGGLGVVEGGLVEVLTRFKVPFSQATAGTLMYRAVSYWFLLAIGWGAVAFLAARNRRNDRTTALVTTGAGDVPGC